MKKVNNSLEIFGDVNLSIPKRMRGGQAGYRTVTYITETPEDKFQRMLTISNDGTVTIYASKVMKGIETVQVVRCGLLFILASAVRAPCSEERILGRVDLIPPTT